MTPFALLRIGFLLGLLVGIVIALLCVAVVTRNLKRMARAAGELRHSNQEMQRLCECLAAEAARMHQLVDSLSRELGREPPEPPVWTIQ